MTVTSDTASDLETAVGLNDNDDVCALAEPCLLHGPDADPFEAAEHGAVCTCSNTASELAFTVIGIGAAFRGGFGMAAARQLLGGSKKPTVQPPRKLEPRPLSMAAVSSRRHTVVEVPSPSQQQQLSPIAATATVTMTPTTAVFPGSPASAAISLSPAEFCLPFPFTPSVIPVPRALAPCIDGPSMYLILTEFSRLHTVTTRPVRYLLLWLAFMGLHVVVSSTLLALPELRDTYLALLALYLVVSLMGAVAGLLYLRTALAGRRDTLRGYAGKLNEAARKQARRAASVASAHPGAVPDFENGRHLVEWAVEVEDRGTTCLLVARPIVVQVKDPVAPLSPAIMSPPTPTHARWAHNPAWMAPPPQQVEVAPYGRAV
ncbi:hypothetical protein H9P43_005111 [Blastocladiella emersonii ATCC 22665]|nr:hypothetical protein H9P43_005111 [Blastocladiella emersonii ATCC 22665]